MKISIIVLTFFFASNVCKAQKSNLLIGSWSGYKKELRNGESISVTGRPYKFDTVIIIQDNGTVIESDSNLKEEYLLRDSLLLMGNRKYLIEKITRKELIIIEYNEIAPKYPLSFRYYFKRKSD